MRAGFRQSVVTAVVVLAAAAVLFLLGTGTYERPSRFESLNDLNRPDCRIGAFEGTGGGDAARRMFPNAKIILFDEAEDAVAAMLGGHLEGYVGAEHFLNVARRVYPLRFRIMDQALSRYPSRAVLAKRNTALLEAVNAFIAEFKRKGIYDDMFVRWCQADRYVPMPEIDLAHCTNGTLRIGTCGLYEPASFIDKSGNLTGYDVEFGTRLAKYLGKKPSFLLKPEGDFEQDLASGRIDVILDNYNDPEPRRGTVLSDGYLDSDMKVLLPEAQPGLEGRLESQMLEGRRFGVAEKMIGDPRLQLFLNGFVNTVSITALAALFGFFLGRVLRIAERRSPRWTVAVFDMLFVFIRRMPPLILLLVFHTGLLPFAPPWLTAVVAFSVWIGAYLEPVADADPLAWLPVLRLRLPILLQWTSIVGYISVFDLTMAVDLVCGRSFKALVPLLSVALAYVALAWLLDRMLAYLERKYRP